MTTVKTKAVANRLEMFGRFWRVRASIKAESLLLRVMRRWKRAMMAPSNSVPLPVLMVVGEKAFQITLRYRQAVSWSVLECLFSY